MAGLEFRNGRYKLILRYGIKRFVRSLKTSDEDEALGRKLRVEQNIHWSKLADCTFLTARTLFRSYCPMVGFPRSQC